MVGSGSTFIFNAAREILASDTRRRTFATYSDAWNPAFDGPHHLVLKSHWGIETLLPRGASGALLPVISVRHPGDSVCSDMERFGFSFDFALGRVALSLKFCSLLRQLPDTLQFRYEDKFTANPRTVSLMARIFGVRFPDPMAVKIAGLYGADSVRGYAATLDGVPNLMRSADNPGDAWCPMTQIHRNHIGKQISGRWRDLTPADRALIDEACGEDAASFGYDCRG